jgi:hypothetical protein
MAAPAAELAQQLTHGQVLTVGEVGDQRRAALMSFVVVLERNLGQRLVEVRAGQIDAEDPRDLEQAVGGVDVIRELLLARAGLSLS